MTASLAPLYIASASSSLLDMLLVVTATRENRLLIWLLGRLALICSLAANPVALRIGFAMGGS